MGKLRAGIVGLGQVGLLFDEDQKRKGIWTHFSAYQKLKDKYELVAACDPVALNRKKAAARKKINTYSDLRSMMNNEPLDVVSICTPPAFHAKQIGFLAGKVKAIICEKPLGLKLSDCQKAVMRSAKKKTLLAVNYYKRFEGPIQTLKKNILEPGKLGKIRVVNGYYSGPFEAVGSHMLDAIRFLFGDITFVGSVQQKKEDQAYSATFKTKLETLVHLIWTGQREKLVFELGIIGTNGRSHLNHNFSKLVWGEFGSSSRYGGYDEIVKEIQVKSPQKERFLPLFNEVAESILWNKNVLTCSGMNALKTQMLMDKIQKKAVKI